MVDLDLFVAAQEFSTADAAHSRGCGGRGRSCRDANTLAGLRVHLTRVVGGQRGVARVRHGLRGNSRHGEGLAHCCAPCGSAARGLEGLLRAIQAGSAACAYTQLFLQLLERRAACPRLAGNIVV